MKLILVLLIAFCCSILLSCENNLSQKDFNSIAADAVSINGFSGDSVKLVKTAGMQCKVADVQQGSKVISELARSLGGMLTHLNIDSREDQTKKFKVSNDSLLQVFITNTNAAITARIPSENLESFLLQVSTVGYFTYNTQMDIADKSLEYLASHLKQGNRTEFLENIGSKNVEGEASFGLIETKDEAIEREIAKRQIDADVKFSIVNLNLYQNAQVRKEMIANDSIEDYGLPFVDSLRNALAAGRDFFLSFLIGLAHLWAFVVAGLIAWIILKYYQQNRRTLSIRKT